MTKPAGGTQTEAAYQQIKDEILTGRLEPGKRLRINEIAVDMKISLGAVREALARLAAEEMAVATAQKGYSVPKVSVEDLADITETRVLVEGECLENSIKHADLDSETKLVAAYHRLANLPERDPENRQVANPAWLEAHSVFHEALVTNCMSPWLLRIRKMLFNQSERYRRLSVSLARTERDVNAEHKAIFDAVMAKDIPLARKLMAEHIRKTTEILLSSDKLSQS